MVGASEIILREHRDLGVWDELFTAPSIGDIIDYHWWYGNYHHILYGVGGGRNAYFMIFLVQI